MKEFGILHILLSSDIHPMEIFLVARKNQVEHFPREEGYDKVN